MSFSQSVKEEILIHAPQARHCRIAELFGIYKLCGSSGEKNGIPYLKFQTENINVARMCFTLLKKTFNITLNLSVRKSKSFIYIICIYEAGAENVRDALKLGETLETAAALLTERDCCRRAFIRGTFLVAGSLNNPERSYHLEIVCGSSEFAEILKNTIVSFEVEAKIAIRKKYYVVYVKEGDGIVDMLNIMEANQSLLSMENTRILKEMRNRVNRSVNCETANIKKTVGAAVRQIGDIEYLISCGAFKELDKGLKEIAELRLENQEATLTELGEMLNPPVGKSGVNHRLRKLSELAEKIRGAV